MDQIKTIQSIRPSYVIIFSACLTAAIFLLDIHTELGVAGGVPYVSVILISLWLSGSQSTKIIAVICSLLTILGFYLSPDRGEIWKAIVNRNLAILVIWVTAFLGQKFKQGAIQLERRNLELNQEIEERKLAERQFKQVVESAPNAILMFDEAGQIFLVNSQSEKLFGYSRTELFQVKISKLLPIFSPETCHTYYQEFSKLGETKVVGRNEDVIGIRKNEAPFSAEIWFSRIQNTEGSFVLASILDNTATKRIQKHKDEIIGVISHELRTPLAVIRSGVENIKDGVVGEITKEQREIIEMLDNNASKLFHIINNLLDISRLESGKVHINLQKIEIQPLLNQILKNFQIESKEKNIIFDVECSAGVSVLADTEMLFQLLVNLLNNALRFAKRKITLRCHSLTEKDSVQVDVIDDGPGISKEKHEVIFGKFIQINRPKDKIDYKGTGLGLAICREILLNLNGKIWVESVEGQGAKFSFTLPKYSDKSS